MGLSRQEYWSGLPSPPPGDLTDLGRETNFSCVPCIAGDSLPMGGQGSPMHNYKSASGNVDSKYKRHWFVFPHKHEMTSHEF